MTNKSAGLKSPQEAFAEALAEEEAATSDSPNLAGLELEPSGDSESIEQPAVETGEEDGVFSVLFPEPEDNQPQVGELHKVKVNGEVLQVSYQELVDGYQRNADYTQGKQEQAEFKKKYANAITLWDALEADYVGTVRAMMSRANVQGNVTPKATPDADTDIEALVERKLQEKLSSDPRIQAFEQQQSLAEMEVIFGAIQKEFDVSLSMTDKQAIMERAQAEGNYDLRYITWKMLQEVERLNAERRNLELVSTIKGRPSVEDDDRTAQPTYFNSPSAAWQAALAEEENLR